MTAPRSAARRAGLVAAVLSLLVLLLPSSVAPVLAADDQLRLVTAAAYVVDPAAGSVHVSIDVSATNLKPNTTSGNIVTSYFYDGILLGIHEEATKVRAVSGRTALRTRVSKEDGYSLLDVTFPSDLLYKQTRKLRITYDLPGGAPRSAGSIRVGPAFTTFYTWAFGDSGSVTISLPAGFNEEVSGAELDKTTSAKGTVLTAASVTNPDDWYAIVVASNDAGLTADRIDLPSGENLVVRSWPGDEVWRTRVGELLRDGLPALHEMIGLDWPVEGDLTVTEVHTPLLEGYAGVFYTYEQRIEVSEDLDDLTIIHEASHAWFNSGLFSERWISEGFADEYASRVLDRVDDGGWNPGAVSPTDSAAVKLNDWKAPGRIDDDETDARETFGYDASWTVIRALVEDVGEDGMREVLKAADSGELAYRGEGVDTGSQSAISWRRFLDLLEERGRSDAADDIFRRWIVSPTEAALMDERASARERYATLVEAGDGWLPPLAVRSPMASWAFDRANERIELAAAVLATRDETIGLAEGIGLRLPQPTEAIYEGARDVGAIDQAQDAAEQQLAATREVVEASDAVGAERDLLTSIGLLDEEPAANLDSAKARLLANELDAATTESNAIDALIAGAPETGRTRALAGGAAVGAALIVFAIGGVMLIRGRRAGPVASGGSYATLAAPPASAADAAPATPAPDEGGTAS